jgi:hypothetical protein
MLMLTEPKVMKTDMATWYKILAKTLTTKDKRTLNALLIENADTVTSDSLLACPSMSVPAGIYAMFYIRMRQGSRQALRNKRAGTKKS